MSYLINWLVQALVQAFQTVVNYVFSPVFAFIYAAFSLLIYTILGVFVFACNGLILIGLIITDQLVYLFGVWLPGILNYNGFLASAFGTVNNAIAALNNLSFLKWSLYWFWDVGLKTMFMSAIAFVLPILIFKIAFRIIRG